MLPMLHLLQNLYRNPRNQYWRRWSYFHMNSCFCCCCHRCCRDCSCCCWACHWQSDSSCNDSWFNNERDKQRYNYTTTGATTTVFTSKFRKLSIDNRINTINNFPRSFIFAFLSVSFVYIIRFDCISYEDYEWKQGIKRFLTIY